MDLTSYVRDVPDFPKEGIVFKDIMPLIGDPDALGDAVKQMADPWRDKGVTHVVAAEARGFIFGTPIAMELKDQLRLKTNLGYILEFHDHGSLPRYEVKAKRFKDLRQLH